MRGFRNFLAASIFLLGLFASGNDVVAENTLLGDDPCINVTITCDDGTSMTGEICGANTGEILAKALAASEILCE